MPGMDAWNGIDRMYGCLFQGNKEETVLSACVCHNLLLYIP